MFAVVGIHRFHPLLDAFQAGQLALQLCNGLRIICTDAAHAGATYFIQQALHLPPLGHIAVAGVYGIGFVHIHRQLSGICVQQAVDLLIIHGVNPRFLAVCQRSSRVNTAAVFTCNVQMRLASSARVNSCRSSATSS